MARFVVDRTKWYRGHSDGSSCLLREDDQRCCIGFVGQQCGVSDRAMLGIAYISEMLESRSLWPKWMFDRDPSDRAILKAYAINDSESLTDTEREKQLAKLFAAYGDEIVFEG